MLVEHVHMETQEELEEDDGWAEYIEEEFGDSEETPYKDYTKAIYWTEKAIVRNNAGARVRLMVSNYHQKLIIFMEGFILI